MEIRCPSAVDLQHSGLGSLQADGFEVSHRKVESCWKPSGFSLQSNRKTREGIDHPDRNAQFEHIAKRVKARQPPANPASLSTRRRKKCWEN